MASSAAERRHGWRPKHTQALRQYMAENDHRLNDLTGSVVKSTCPIFANIDTNFLGGRVRSMRQKLSKSWCFYQLMHFTEKGLNGASILIMDQGGPEDDTISEPNVRKKIKIVCCDQ